MNKFYNFVNKSDVCEVYLYGDVGAWDEVNVADFKAHKHLIYLKSCRIY